MAEPTQAYYYIGNMDNVYTKVYDGSKLQANAMAYQGYLDEDSVVPQISEGSLTHVNEYGTMAYDETLGKNVGTLELHFDEGCPKVYRDGEEVTGEYNQTQVTDPNFQDLTPGCKTFTIISRDVTLVSANLTKEYDGTALTAYSQAGGTDVTDSTAGMTDKGYVSGQEFTYAFTGSQLFVGSSENTFTVSDSDTALTSDYNVTTKYGTLTVTQRTSPLTITIYDQEKDYDGTAVIDTSEDVYSVEGLATDDTITVTITNTNVDAGFYEDGITATYTIMHNNGDGTYTDVTSMYANVTIDKGDLTINKCNVTITSGDATKEYDGTPLANDTITVSGFIGDDGIATATVTGSQTEIGSSNNTFTYELKAGTKAENYDITTKPGTLVVTPVGATAVDPEVDPSAGTASVTLDAGETSNRYVQNVTAATVATVTNASAQKLSVGAITANGDKAVVENTGTGSMDIARVVATKGAVEIDNDATMKIETLSAATDVTIDNDGHLEANVLAGGKLDITNTSANTLIGDYAGETVSVKNTSTGKAENVTLQAYRESAAFGAASLTLVGEKGSVFTGDTVIVSGYNATPEDVSANDGTCRVNLDGENTFTGTLTIKSGAITTTGDAPAVLNLKDVKAKMGMSSIGRSISVNISGESSLCRIDGATLNVSADYDSYSALITLKDGVTLGEGTNFASDEDWGFMVIEGDATLKDGAKVTSANRSAALSTVADKTLTLTGEGTSLTVAGGLTNNGTIDLQAGATLNVYIRHGVTNTDATINLKGGTITGGAISGGTVNWVLDNSEYTASSLAWSTVSGASTKTITVDADAEVNDTYTLATDAGEAAGTGFTLVGAGYDQTITVGGDAVDCNGLQYTLALNSSDELVLSVTGVSTVEAIAEYAGGQSGQHTNKDAFTYYTKADKVAAAAFGNPGAEKGATSYKWIVSDEWVGYENAKTQYNWDEATKLDGKGVALGESTGYKFVYLAGYDEDGNQVSMDIYQALRDTTAPAGFQTIRGDADAATGWINAASKNKTVTGHTDGKEDSPIITESTTTVGDDGYFAITLNAVDKPEGAASGVAVTEPDGDVQKYEISTDGGATWTEYTQADPWTVTDGTYSGFKYRVTDKAGNTTTATFTGEIKVDFTDAELADIKVNGTIDETTGWYNENSGEVTITGTAVDATSGVASVEYQINGGDWQAATDTDRWTVTVVDSTTVNGDVYKFRVTDVAGNVSTAEYKLADALQVDQTDATFTNFEISGDPAKTGWYNLATGQPSITVTAEDNLSGVAKIQYTTVDAPTETDWNDMSITVDGLTATGTLQIDDTGKTGLTYKFRVIDVAGNVSEISEGFGELKVDTVAPDMTNAAFSVEATEASNLSSEGTVQTVTYLADGTWITNRADVGTGTFTLGGTLKLDEDTGSKVTPSIKVTYEYQTWDSITNSWVSVKTTETYDYPNTGVWTYDTETGDWKLTTTLDTVANAAGTFTIEVSAKDEAGNKSATKTFTGNFDNTMPSNPTVTLCDIKGMDFGTSGSKAYIDAADIYSQTGDDIAVKAVDGTTANEADGIKQAAVAYRYWTTTTGKFDLYELGEKLATNAVREAAVDTIVSVDNADKYWGDGTVATDDFGNKTMAEDAYNIAFYDQNAVGTYSSGQSSATDLSYAHFIVDRTAIDEEIVFTNADGEAASYDEKDADGKVVRTWVKADADGKATMTDTVRDYWVGDDAKAEGYTDHTSNVKSATLTVDSTEKGVVATEGGALTAEFDTLGQDYVVKTATEDNAGNVGGVDMTVALDNAGPTAGTLQVAKVNMMGSKLVDAYEGEANTYYLNPGKFETDDGTICEIKLVQNGIFDSYKADGTAEEAGAGVDLDASYWTIGLDGAMDFTTLGFNKADGGKTTEVYNAATDGKYNVVYTLVDNVGNVTETQYTVVVDTVGATWALADGYTYTVDGGADAKAPKGPVTTTSVVEQLVQDAYVFDWSNNYNFTWDLDDATAGLASYQAYKKNTDGAWVADGDLTTLDDDFSSINISGNAQTPDNEGVVEKKYVITDKAGNTSDLLVTLKLDTTIDGTVKVSVADDKHANYYAAEDKYYVNATKYNLDYTEVADGKSDANFVYERENGTGDYAQTALTDNFASLEKEKTDGTTTTHNAIITDAAGNQKTLDATVVVDTTAATITLKNAVEESVLNTDAEKIGWWAPTDINSKASNTTELTAGKDLTSGFSSSWFNSLDADFVVTVSDTNLAKVTVNGAEQAFTDASLDYTIAKDSLAEGANTYTIVATDKAGNETTSEITLNYDSVGPTINTITIDGRVAESTATSKETAAKFWVKDSADAISITIDATDATSGLSANYYTYSADGSSWGFWTTVTTETTLSAAGYYRFASVDNAGNYTLSGYYNILVDTETPDQVESLVRGGTTESDNFVEYTQDGQRINASEWVNTNQGKDVVLKVTFNNEAEESAETHYVTTKFDIAAYNKALAAYKLAGKTDNEARELALADGATAAGGEWIAVGKTFGTDDQATLDDETTLTATYDVNEHSTYYFYSKDEIGHVSEYSVNEVKIDNVLPEFERVKLDDAATGNVAFKVNVTDLGGSGVNADTIKIKNQTEEAVTFYLGGVETTLAAGAAMAYVSGTRIEIAKSVAKTDTFLFTANDNAGNTVEKTIGSLSIESVTMDGDALSSTELIWNDIAKATKGQALLNVTLAGLSGDDFALTGTLEYWDADQEAFVALEKVVVDDHFKGFALPQGKYETLTLRATAGGATATRTYKAGVDFTAPVVTTEMTLADGTAYDGSGWTNQDVTVKADYTDSLSGVNGRSFEDQVVSAESATVAGTTVTFTATDVSGNEGTGSATVKIDKTAATVSATATATKDGETFDYTFGTWTNADKVSVTVTATDNLSGFDAAGTLTKTLLDNETRTAEGWYNNLSFMASDATDMAGNAFVGETSYEVMIDRTAAEITLTATPESLTSRDVVLTATIAIDALSEQGGFYWSVDGGESWTTEASDTFTLDAATYANRSVTVLAKSTDEAGNVSQASYTVDYIYSNTDFALTNTSISLSAGTYAFDTLAFAGTSSLKLIGDAALTAEYVTVGEDATATITGDNVITAKGKDSAGKSTKSKTSLTIASGATLNTTEAQLKAFEAYKKFDVDGATINVTGDGDATDLKWAIKNGVSALSYTGDISAQTVSFNNTKAGVQNVTAKTWSGIAGKTDSITTSAKTDVRIDAAIDFADKADKITVGSDASFTAGAVDFGAGTDTLTVGARSYASFSKVTDLEKLTVTAGKKDYSTRVIIDGFADSTEDLAHTFAFGNYTDVNINSDVTLDNTKADRITVGTSAQFVMSGNLDLDEGNDTLTTGASSTTTLGHVDLGLGNDTLAIGADATFDAYSLDFGALDAANSTDKLTVGARATAKVTGAITGVNTITTAAGKAASSAQLMPLRTTLTAGDVTLLSGKADTVTLGNYSATTLGKVTFGTMADKLSVGSDAVATFDALDFGDGANQLTVGARSTVEITDSMTGTLNKLTVTAGTSKSGTVTATTLKAGGTISGTAKADTYTIGNYADVKLGTVDLGEGNDTVKIGNYSTVEFDTLDFGDGTKDALTIGAGSTLIVDTLDNLETLTMTTTKGKESTLCITDVDSFNAAQEKWGAKYGSQIVNTLA